MYSAFSRRLSGFGTPFAKTENSEVCFCGKEGKVLLAFAGGLFLIPGNFLREDGTTGEKTAPPSILCDPKSGNQRNVSGEDGSIHRWKSTVLSPIFKVSIVLSLVRSSAYGILTSPPGTATATLQLPRMDSASRTATIRFRSFYILSRRSASNS